MDQQPGRISLRKFYVNSPFEPREYTDYTPKKTTTTPLPNLHSQSTPNLSLKALLPKWNPFASVVPATNDHDPTTPDNDNTNTTRFGDSPNTSLLRSVFDTSTTTIHSNPTSIKSNSSDPPPAPTQLPSVKSQFLTVYIISCHGIVAADSNGKSDPYVQVEFSGKTLQTKCIQDETNPLFDELLNFGRRPRSGHQFTLQVFDKDDFGDPDLLGTVVIPLNTFHDCKPKPSKYIFGQDTRKFVTKVYDLELPPEFVMSSTKLSSTITLMWSHEQPMEEPFSISNRRSRSNTHESFDDDSILPSLTGSTSNSPRDRDRDRDKDRKRINSFSSTPDNNTWVKEVLELNQATKMLRLTDSMYTMTSWNDLKIKFSNGIRNEDKSELVKLGKPSNSLVVVLISSELRLRSQNIYSYKATLEIENIIHILDAGHTLEKTLEYLLLFLLDKWTTLPSLSSVAKLRPKSGIKYVAISLLSILCAIPFTVWTSRAQLLNMFSKSNIDDEILDVALMAVHGILCTNKKGEYSISNVSFWNILRKKFCISIAPTKNITLTEGLEANETKRLTEEAWYVECLELPLAMSVIVCHNTLGTAFVKDLPVSWYNETDGTELFYAILIQVLALTTSTASMMRSAHDDSIQKKDKTKIKSIATIQYTRTLLSSLKRNIMLHLNRPTLVRFSLLGCLHLPIMDAVLRSSDPYAIISLNGKHICTTDARPRTLRPKWKDVILCMTSWNKQDVIEICMYDRDSSFGAKEGDFVASEDTEDDEIGRITLNISKTKDGQHTAILMLPEDVEPSSSEHLPTVQYSMERIDLLPTLTLIDTRLKKSFSFLNQKVDEKEEQEEQEEQEVRPSQKIKSDKNEKNVSDRSIPVPIDQTKNENAIQKETKPILLQTVEAARARLTDLNARPSTTLQDLCSVICLLDNQTLADLSAIFHSGTRQNLHNDSNEPEFNIQTNNHLIQEDDEFVPTMSKNEAIEQASPKRGGTASTSEGWATEKAFRKGIVHALLQCGFQPPEEEALNELIASLDEQQRGIIKFSTLSGKRVKNNIVLFQ